MQVGCGFRVKAVKGQEYVYFWHYEDRGGKARQVYAYMGPRRSATTADRLAGEDEAEAATTADRVKCTTRCARTVAKPRRSRLSRTLRGPSTAEIVSQSAGRDGSSQERQQSVRTLFRFELQPVMRLARSSTFFI